MPEALSELDRLFEEEEISEETKGIIESIMEEQGLDEVDEVNEDYRTFSADGQKYTWRRNDNEAEEEAKEYLENGELWRMAVEAKNTTKGLDDWIDEVIGIDGWQASLCSYDGGSYELKSGVVYWRTG